MIYTKPKYRIMTKNCHVKLPIKRLELNFDSICMRSVLRLSPPTLFYGAKNIPLNLYLVYYDAWGIAEVKNFIQKIKILFYRSNIKS